MVFPKEMWIILASVLIVCLCGFKKYVWFISVGYGFSISVIGLMTIILFNPNMDFFNALYAGVMVLYGIRLGGYLLLREKKSAAYNAKMKNEISDGSHMPFYVKVLLWISCAFLYVLMTCPIIYRSVNGFGWDYAEVAGIIVTLTGIAFESIADYQKSMAKKVNPKRFCDKGLFTLVRCPNYFGELLVWTGVFISGFTVLKGFGQWLLAIIGYLGIVYIMFSGARRLELRQDRTYGKDTEYQKYVKETPILLPFVKLYSVKKYTWLVG